MTSHAHISQEDLALYAMQSLCAKESVDVQLHLRECSACRDELAAVSGDLGLVAMSVEEVALPLGARQRFLDRIAASEVSEKASAAQGRHVVPIAFERTVSTSLNWFPWAIAAALLVVSIVLGAKIRTLNQQLRQETALAARQAAASSRAEEVLDVLTASGAQHVLLIASTARPTPTARAVYLAERGGLIFQANNLDLLPAGKTYELWIIPATGKAPIPAGLFRPDSSGSASIILPALPKGVPAKAFGVTIEEAKGSTTPTAPIILAGAAPSAGS